MTATCPLCQGERTKPRYRIGDRLFGTTDKVFDVHHCDACQTDFLHPVPDMQELAGYYPEGYWVGPAEAEGTVDGRRGDPGLLGKLSDTYRRLVLRDHVRFVRRAVQQQRQRNIPVRILDIGCGDGSFLDVLNEKPCMGMDTSIGALRAARTRGLSMVQGVLIAADGETPVAPFPDHSLSVVTMFHFLEHVPDPRPILAEVKRILRPDGNLVVQVPNRRSWQARVLGRRWAGLDVPRHLVNYSDVTLRDTLERCGFDVARQTHFSLRDNPTTVANSVVPGLYPPGRVARHGPNGSAAASWLCSLGYLTVTALATPFTLVESLFGRGAAIMIQARPRHA